MKPTELKTIYIERAAMRSSVLLHIMILFLLLCTTACSQLDILGHDEKISRDFDSAKSS